MNIVLFSTIHWDWDTPAILPAQLSLQLAQQGHHILFIQPRPRTRTNEIDPRVRVVPLTDLSMDEALVERAWHGLGVGPLDGVAKNLLALMRSVNQPEQPSVAIWFAPFDPFARLLPLLRAQGSRLVYYPLDNFEAMIPLGIHRHNLQAEEYLATHADAIVVLSQPMAEKMRRFGHAVYMIPDGVNLEEFADGSSPAPAPVDVLRGKRTLGFWGYLSPETVDADLLAYVAHAQPDWAFNLWGQYDSKIEPLGSLPNLRLHGYVPHERLKEYARGFDVAIMPTPDNGFTRARDPVKVYEYLAAHKPVVCSYMPQLAGRPYVWVASNPLEFIECVQSAAGATIDLEALDEFLAKQTWTARAQDLVELLNQLCAGGAPVSPAEADGDSLIAPSFAPGVESLPPLVLSYLTGLERQVAQAKQMERFAAESDRWAKSLEALVQQRDRERQRLSGFLPLRLLKTLAHFWNHPAPGT